MHYRNEFVPRITQDNIDELRKKVPNIDHLKALALDPLDLAKNYCVEYVNRDLPVHYCVNGIELVRETAEGFEFRVRVFD